MGASFALFASWSLAYEGVLLLNSADGLTYQQITDHLGITLRTVKFHVKNVYSKVGVSNRREFCQLGTVPNWHNRRDWQRNARPLG